MVNSFHCLVAFGFMFRGWQRALLVGWVFCGMGLAVVFLVFRVGGSWPHSFSVGWLFGVVIESLLWGWPSFSFGVFVILLSG